jgi:hypothetical protein
VEATITGIFPTPIYISKLNRELTNKELLFIDKVYDIERELTYNLKTKQLKLDDSNFNSIVFSYEVMLEFEQYEIDIKKSEQIYNNILLKKYADYVFKKSQINEIINTNDYIVIYYENKKLLIDINYYNFLSPIKVYPNKYYAFLYYGRSNQYEQNINVLFFIIFKDAIPNNVFPAPQGKTTTPLLAFPPIKI